MLPVTAKYFTDSLPLSEMSVEEADDDSALDIESSKKFEQDEKRKVINVKIKKICFFIFSYLFSRSPRFSSGFPSAFFIQLA